MDIIKKIELYKAAINKYSPTDQVNMALEECGEFIVAVNKYRRSTIDNHEQRKTELCGEIADVIIMMEQMALMFGRGEVEKIMLIKLTRLEGRLKKVNDN